MCKLNSEARSRGIVCEQGCPCVAMLWSNNSTLRCLPMRVQLAQYIAFKAEHWLISLQYSMLETCQGTRFAIFGNYTSTLEDKGSAPG